MTKTSGSPSHHKLRKAAVPGPDEIASIAFISDRKSTRLNSSHANISYAVFCLKKKNIEKTDKMK